MDYTAFLQSISSLQPGVVDGNLVVTVPGRDGEQGTDGATGVSGVDGINGNTGPTGAQGPTGPAGPAGGGGGGGGGSSLSVYQLSHGMTVGDAVYANGITWTKAKADNIDTLAIGMIGTVSDSNNFTVLFSGIISGLTGITSGAYYYVSSSVAGGITTAEPSAAYSNPILYGLTITAGFVLPWRPIQTAK